MDVDNTSDPLPQWAHNGGHGPPVLISPWVSPRQLEHQGQGPCHSVIRLASGGFATLAIANSGLVVAACAAWPQEGEESELTLLIFHLYSCAMALCLLLAATENRSLLRRVHFLEARGFLFLLETYEAILIGSEALASPQEPQYVGWFASRNAIASGKR